LKEKKFKPLAYPLQLVPGFVNKKPPLKATAPVKAKKNQYHLTFI
tara:strand:- start:2265 stop:2399 length:135 start_codon:yes stop_codon:yes gene_type:complete